MRDVLLVFTFAAIAAFWGDLTLGAESLDDVWQVALAGDRRLAASQSAVYASESRTAAAAAQRWPRLSVEGGYLVRDNETAFVFSGPAGFGALGPFPYVQRESFVAGARATLPLYTSGRIENQHLAADSQSTASRAAAARTERPGSPEQPRGMVWIPGGEFTMGSDESRSQGNERPAHRVRVDGFWIDATPVTNAQFRVFADATGYVTTAERVVDWEELKKQVAPGTPKPPAEMLQPGSLVFAPPDRAVRLDDMSGWWRWTIGACWRRPDGPGTDLAGKDDEPVVHMSWDDAVAYANWAGKRLPTEAEWERAARGGLEGKRFAWGDEFLGHDVAGKPRHLANTFQGEFPHRGVADDGFPGRSPVRSFPAQRLRPLRHGRQRVELVQRPVSRRRARGCGEQGLLREPDRADDDVGSGRPAHTGAPRHQGRVLPLPRLVLRVVPAERAPRHAAGHGLEPRRLPLRDDGRDVAAAGEEVIRRGARTRSPDLKSPASP